MGQTIAEKIFAAHLRDEPFDGTYVLDLDRVLCHEITTPIAIQEFGLLLQDILVFLVVCKPLFQDFQDIF